MNTDTRRARAEQDIDPMERALELALGGLRRAAPNPMVGAVVVDANGRIVGEGFHQHCGGPHAEVMALAAAGGAARGATLHVSLEPCCHHGRTPPCTEAIVRAGIACVVFGVNDPDPRASGRGVQELEAAGIVVAPWRHSLRAAALNRPYFTRQTKSRPYVIAKWAMSLDGRIATASGESRWITSAEARQHAHEVRDRVDAILVGAGTITADDPELTCRGVPEGRSPIRIVLDGRLQIPVEARVIQSARATPTWILTTESAEFHRVKELEDAGAVILYAGRGPRVDLSDALTQLARREITNLLVEGGPDSQGTFLDHSSIDEVMCYVAPMIIGGDDALSAIAGSGAARLQDALALDDLQFTPIGRDLLISGRTPWSYQPLPAM